jgi:hypothetical protein
MLTFMLSAWGWVRAEEVCPKRETIETPKPSSTARIARTARRLMADRILLIWRAL